uniref:Uncharacterized protein n=1 Tax=Knipowitschia caucasica TaxID=637954 RepID=A0AAV2LH57_KNICA
MSPLRRPVGHKLSVGLPESQQDSTPTSIDFHDQQWERRTGLLHHQALDLELFGSVVNLGRRDVDPKKGGKDDTRWRPYRSRISPVICGPAPGFNPLKQRANRRLSETTT